MSRILVTGATDGIGRQTALELARQGHVVVVHGRSADRIAATAAYVAQQTGRVVETVRADLAVAEEVEGLAREVAARGPVDVVVHNAGVYAERYATNAAGFELTWAVNHLAPFLLTHLLLPAIPRGGRIVVVSSGAHRAGRIAWDDPNLARAFHPYAAYAQSKLANVLFAAELARRLPSGPTANSLHPGVVSTKLLRAGFRMEGPDSLADGAATSVHLATSPAVAGVTGRYFEWRREATPSAAARDVASAKALYALSARQVGVAELPEP